MRDLGNSARGNTPFHLRWPDTPEFTQVVSSMAGKAVDHMLEVVWLGYLDFVNEFLKQIDISLADEELERTVTQALEPHIRRRLTGDEAYDVQHGCYEYETRAAAPAQPPEYDIAFFLKNNSRIMWPLEAKILRTPANVAPYVKDINDEFLTGRYAPFSRSAAMLGYLISGEGENVPSNIKSRLGCDLSPHSIFYPEHIHYISDHQRTFANKTWASGDFQCHHLIMPLKVVEDNE